MPDAWSFIGLDTADRQEYAPEPPPLPWRDHLLLASDLTDHRGLNKILLEKYRPGTEPYGRHMIGWLPKPPRVPLQHSPGQFRAVGRAVGLHALEGSVRARVHQAFRDASQMTGIGEVAPYLGIQVEQHQFVAEPLVVVIASTAGGTGAGIALDVVELIRRTDPLGRLPCLVLFSNDVFGDNASEAMAGNSLGMLCELLASYWNDRDPGAGDIFSSNVANPGHGPASVFVVGSQDMASDRKVAACQAAGEALSGWTVEPRIQDTIRRFILQWDRLSKENTGGYPFARNDQPGVMSSFGAAVVTVGRTRFERWARDLLCYQVLEGVRRGHLRADQLPPSDEALTQSERVDKIAEKYWRVLYGAVSMSGEILEGDDVGGLAATNCVFTLHDGDETRETIADQLRSCLEADIKKLPVEWLTSLEMAYGDCLVEVEEHARTVSERARARWATAVTKFAAASASRVVGETSLEVAIGCIQHLQVRVRQAVRELQADASVQADLARQERARTLGDLRMARDKVKLDHSSNLVARAFEASVESLLQEWSFLRSRVIDDLVETALDEVYGSLQRVLLQALHGADAVLESEDAIGCPTSLDNIPDRYLPTGIELPLESHNEWGPLLQDLCSDAPRPTERGDPVSAARTLLIAGDMDGAQDDTAAKPLVAVDPDRPEWFPGSGLAAFTCDMSFEAVGQRVEAWMGTARFGTVLREGIRSYLTPESPSQRTTADPEERCETFKRRLLEAASLAKPLVEIDDNLHSLVYGETRGEPSGLVCSPLPLEAWHPSCAVAERILGSGIELCSEDTSSVLVTSFISKPVHPVVVKSLIDPIAEAVERCQGDIPLTRSAFWSWRRARTLLDFVPVAPGTLEAMIRGFAVGRLCGYVTADHTEPIRISGRPHPDDDRQEVAFPWPFLSEMQNASDVLPALLESFALCFAEVGAKGLDAFEAYRRLHDLGDHHDGEPRLRDLRTILKGQDPPSKTVDTPRALGTGDESGRGPAAIAYLEANVAYFRRMEDMPLTGEEYCDSRGFPHSYVALREILPTARECYEALQEDVQQIIETGRSPR